MNLNAPSVPGALPLFPFPPWAPPAAKGASRAERGEGTRQEQCPQNFLLISEDTEPLGPSEMRSLKFCDEKRGERALSVNKNILFAWTLPIAVRGCCAPQLGTPRC